MIFLYSSFGYSQTIEITIDNQPYVREYPKTLEESHELIDDIVSLYNELDNVFVSYKEKTIIEEETLKKKIDELININIEYKNYHNMYSKKLLSIESYVDTKLKVPTDVLLIGSIGPTLSLEDVSIGTRFELGVIKSLHIFNMYTGLNLNTSIYYNAEKKNVRDIGLSIYLGMFLN
jgi:hypothetical protein